jgi:hypothetical protein
MLVEELERLNGTVIANCPPKAEEAELKYHTDAADETSTDVVPPVVVTSDVPVIWKFSLVKE